MGANTEVVREALDAFLSGRRNRALELAHPDIVSVRPPPFPDPQTYHGREGVSQMWADWTTDFEEFEMQALEFVERGDNVVVGVLQRGTGKASGVPVDAHYWMVFRVVEGRIARLDVYLSRKEALAAVSPPG